MKQIILALGACAVLAPLAAQAQPLPVDARAVPAPADTILTNGKIYTPSGWASALAISHGAIVAVGDASAVERHRTPNTRVVDLNGQTVLPGLHDMHVHPGGAGMEQFRCQIPHGSGPQQIFDITAACAAKLQPGE